MDLERTQAIFMDRKALLHVDFSFGFTYLLSISLKDDLWSKWSIEILFYRDKMRLQYKWSVEIHFTWINEITDGRRMRWRCAKQQGGPLRVHRANSKP